MLLLDKFIIYLGEQVANHSIYVWGSQGQTAPTITEAWIKKMENSSTNAQRAIAYWQKQVKSGYGNVLRAFDCSGLGMYWMQNQMGLYKSDMSSNSMMGKCKKLKRQELQRGDWVFRVDSTGKAYHIGYVVDAALNVIEAKGRDDGVVKRVLDVSGTSYWNAYGRPDVFAADIQSNPSGAPAQTTATVLQITSPLMRGSNIQALQSALNGLGYPCGTADGVCGNNTMNGIKAFIKAHAEV